MASIESQMPGDQAHRPKTGETIRAPNLGKSYDTVRDLSVSVGRAGEVDSGLGNAALTYLGVVSLGAPGTGLVVCQQLEDTQPSPQQYAVLLPPTFYELSRGGTTYVYTSTIIRTATNGGDIAASRDISVYRPAAVETQYLQPSIVAGDVLLCGYVRGVWIDLNIDGRQWAADPPP